MYYPLLGRTRFWAGVEQRFNCLIVRNRKAVQSMGDFIALANMIDGLFFCVTLTGRRRGHTHLCKHGAEMSDTGAESVKPNPRCSWQGHSREGGCRCRGWKPESTEFRGVFQPLLITSVIRQDRRTSAYVVSWTDELLCGGYKWVSPFDTPCIPTRWTGERWVEMSRLHGTAC